MRRSATTFSFSLAALLPLAPLAVLAAGCSDNATDDAAGGAGGAAGGEPATGGAASGGRSSQAGTTNQGGSVNSAGGAGNAGDASFGGTDGVARGPAPVELGAASEYVIVAQSAISNVPTSAVTGNLGLSPAAASYITGFSLTKAGPSWTSAQVNGSIFAANNDPPTPKDLTTAVANMQTAYTDAAGRPSPEFLNLGAGAIGGLTLAPGLYQWTSSVTVPTDVTLAGDGNDVWIFQITGDLKMAAAKRMILSGGADAKNIFRQVAGFVDFGTTSHAEGIVLSKTAIKLQTGATINGRLLAQTAVNLDSATVTEP